MRTDEDLPGALVGEEAHIVARSPGGPRYEPLEPKARDGYANLVLLCANDHTEVDAQPARYTVERLRTMKQGHELWVTKRLDSRSPAEESNGTQAVVMQSGADIWDVMTPALAYQCGSPTDLADGEAEVIDEALQTFVDWGEIGDDVIARGFRAIRDGKRSMQAALDSLVAAGFVVLGGERHGPLAGGQVTGRIAVLEIVRANMLSQYAASSPAREAAAATVLGDSSSSGADAV